jgi:hypothetical protein
MAAALSSFREYYHDNTQDEHNQAYAPLMQAFAVPNGQNPATLRDLSTNNPEATSVGYIIMCQDPQNPAGPGYIRAVHNMARYRAALGQPATIWDGRMFGSTGDTVGTQIPATVELPGTLFQQLNNGATYRVANAPLMALLFGDPNRQLCGPYADQDVATELVQCRNCVPVPHRYMEYFITGTRSPREAWEVVGHALNVNGDEANCKILFDFLRLACTLNAAGDTSSPLVGNDLTTPVSDVALIQHRTTLINVKLPGLNRVPTLQAGTEIVAAIGGIITEQRATRQDALDRRNEELTKTPDQYYGASIIHVLRMCQVAVSSDLPPVYQALAQAGKKKARLTMQLALDVSAEELGYPLRIQLSPDVASKIDGLLWKCSHQDLGVGINPCTFGDSDPESMQVNSDIIRHFDLLNDGGASASLQDIQTLIGKSKVSLARTFVELECALKMFHIYLHTFYGPGHAVTTSWRIFADRSNNEYRTLQYYGARTPRHQFLVPALVQHWCKLKFAYYVEHQWTSNGPVSVPDFVSLWEKIATGEQWESPLPEQYLASLPVPRGPDPVPTPTPPRPSPAPGTPGTPAGTRTGSTAVANLNYNATKFSSFKELGLMVRDVIARAETAGHPLPKNDRGLDMCITFHVKGFCNANCRRNADHSPPGPVRNPAEESRLHAWCETCYVASA